MTEPVGNMKSDNAISTYVPSVSFKSYFFLISESLPFLSVSLFFPNNGILADVNSNFHEKVRHVLSVNNTVINNVQTSPI